MAARLMIGLRVLAIGLVLACAGCGGGSRATPETSPTPTPAASVEIPPGATIVDLFVPDQRISEFQVDGQLVTSITVTAGVPYAFQVDNPGEFDHNFFIGIAEDLAAREYARLDGEHLWSRGQRTVVYTFEAGAKVQFACTLAGHYGPMHGDFVIEP